MGYYTGNGVTVGGGSSYSTLRSFAVYGGGSFSLRQKKNTTINVRNGVSLNTAQSAQAYADLHATIGSDGSWIVFDTNGTKIDVTYSRIEDSNLYSLQTTTEVTTVDTVTA